MIKILTLYIIIFSVNNLIGQKEYEIHLESINNTYFPGHPIDDFDSTFNANKPLINYVMKNNLLDASDIRFISNRKLLPKLESSECDSIKIKISDTLITGEFCEIILKTRKFDSTRHIIKWNQTNDYHDSIDGQIPYGAYYGIPYLEIKELSIKLDGKYLDIPNSAYSNFYEPNLCNPYEFDRKIEAYTSIDGKYLYIYIYGGNAAGTYFSKLIFDKEKFITKIAVDYIPLMKNHSFRKSFIGY